MKKLPVSHAYRNAVRIAVILQIVMTLLMSIILDGGELARTGGCALGGFWIGTAIIMLRRPSLPSSFDLLYVRWGYIPMLIIGVYLSPLAGVLRGHH